MQAAPGHILVVDDHKPNRLKLSLGLKKQGHTVDVAENGRDALDKLRAQPFDLVLLDIMMPEMDGYEVLRQMKNDSTLRAIPVIIISALDEIDSVVKGIELGAEDYLPKSFNPVLLKARVGACLEKKRLRDSEQLYLKGLERELEIGREIQASFLPATLPQLPGWEIATRFRAAREVAGDFYDAFSLPQEEKFGLVLGDVCGKGVGAAMFMTLFRSLIRAVVNLAGNANWFAPSVTTDLVNGSLETITGAANLKDTIYFTNNYIAYTHSQAHIFASIFFGLLDPATGTLTYINGGHEPPIIFNEAGVKTSLEPTGPVVGIMPDMTFNVASAQLAPGDTLLAFTDGVTEARNSAGEMFTRERLVANLVQPAASAAGLLDQIEAHMQAFTAGTNQLDDITMLAVRRITTSDGE